MSEIVWLSGARGFVGENVRRSFLDAGSTVKCLSNSVSDDENIIQVDYSIRDQIRKVFEKHDVPETFIHLGWGNVYQPHHESHITSNLEESINLIDELYSCGLKRFLSIGSSSEYGDKTGLLQETYSATEGVNNYVLGKQMLAKHGLKAAEKLNRIFVHVRLFYTYGVGQKHNSLLNQLFKTSVQGGTMNLSPCVHYRDYLHIAEAAEGIRKIAGVNQSGTINLGSGSVIQLKEFVQLLWKELGADPDLLIFGSHDVPISEQSQPRSFADLSTLKNRTLWSPSLSIEEGIKMTVEQFRLSL
jgi:nucleoside-diphosphate-sugar epimerase